MEVTDKKWLSVGNYVKDENRIMEVAEILNGGLLLRSLDQKETMMAHNNVLPYISRIPLDILAVLRLGFTRNKDKGYRGDDTPQEIYSKNGFDLVYKEEAFFLWSENDEDRFYSHHTIRISYVDRLQQLYLQFKEEPLTLID